MFPPGGITFPWPVFDGTVPDVPPSTMGKTWYADAKNGNDAHDGSSLANAKKTFQAALNLASAGDTVLLAGGLYREHPSFDNVSGAMGKPLTIGSYGHGTGAPILDGGEQPAMWTKTSGSVWQSSTAGLKNVTSGQPVLSIYVNTGMGEYALREVPHGQIQAYGSDPLPPNQTQANIKDNSNQWYFDAAGKTVYADFGGTLGSGDPNTADISLLYNTAGPGHQPLIVLGQGHDYFTFIGLTIRAGSWHGVYSESKGHTFDHCDVKFNGGGGIFFDAGGNDLTITDNTVTMTRIWMNVLDNWPRFNNMNTTGGWPGALSWYSQSNALSQGNVVYQNGGEGLILWGTNSSGGTTHVSMNNRVWHNIVFDNWSVNVYCDNTQNGRIEQNFVFDHPRDVTQTFDNLFTLSQGYNTDYGKRITPVNISLADEPGSANDSQAHLSNMTVLNNIFAGGKFGFVDYDDGTSGVVHGLKNCTIENNTWILGNMAIPGQTSYGWRHLFPDGNADASTASLLENNVFVTTASDDHFAEMGRAGAGPGITLDYNVYSGPGGFLDAGNTESFTQWKAARSSWDGHSVAADAMIVDVTEFSQTGAQKFVYDWSKAKLQAGSAAIGAGTQVSVTTDFTNTMRPSGAMDVGALSH
jgi:hypothetical protein